MLVVRTPGFYCHGKGSVPGRGTETPQAMQCDQMCVCVCVCVCVGFPGSSAGKGSRCNAGDPGLIPGSGRSLGEEICSPLQYSWASLGKPRFDPWVGKTPWRMAWQPMTIFLPGGSPWTEEPGRLQSMESKRVRDD